MTAEGSKKFLDVLAGKPASPPPVWMMRQAGRHLPEYLETRSKARDFLDFCYTPSLAAEATLQPVRRYGMDAAILFADILLILDAMGLGVTFEKGEGPLVEVIKTPADLARVKPQAAADKLSPVYETVSRVKAALPPSCALIGFAGSPWTVTLYAVEGRGKTDKSMAWRWAHGRPDDLAAAMDLVSEATAHYLARQVEAGADALMLFDSWAEGLPDNIFEEVIIAPTKKLVARLRGDGRHRADHRFPARGRGDGAGLCGSYRRHRRRPRYGRAAEIYQFLPAPEFPGSGPSRPLAADRGWCAS
jgi:uroporphyrinogen decarboxylase